MTTTEFILSYLRTLKDSERGASLVEYALLLALIAILCMAAIGFLGDQASEAFDSIGGSVEAAN